MFCLSLQRILTSLGLPEDNIKANAENKKILKGLLKIDPLKASEPS